MAGRASRLLGWLATLVIVVGGCAAPPSSPRDTLSALASALRRGDAEAAYALMSSSYRERVSLEELARVMREQPEEIRATAEALEHPLAIEEEARARLSSGDEIVLRGEDGAFRVTTDVLDAYANASPQEALRSFVRAIERERFDVVLRLLPAAERERWSAEALRAAWRGDAREAVQRIVTGLRDALDGAHFEQTGDRAVMSYGDRHRAVLVREARGWVVESPE